MKNLRSSQALLLALLLLISLVGCKSVEGDTTKPTSEPTVPTTAAPTAAPATEPTTAAATVTTTMPSPHEHTLADELMVGHWVASIPNYRGSGEEYSFRLIFFEGNQVSADLLREPAGLVNPSNEIAASYAGTYAAEGGRLRMTLFLDFEGNGVDPNDVPRDEIQADYSVQYEPEGQAKTLTLSEPAADLLLLPKEFSETSLTFTQEIRPGMSFLNPLMVRLYMAETPEIRERMEKQSLAIRVTNKIQRVENIDCMLVHLGTHHYDQFVTEYHFCLAQDGRVWEYDPVSDTYTLLRGPVQTN